MLEERDVSLNNVEPVPLDTVYVSRLLGSCIDYYILNIVIFNSCCRFSNVFGDEYLSHAGSGSGGYLHHVFSYAAKHLFGEEVEDLTYKTLK